MSKTSIPDKTVSALWAASGGRCEYRGCNQVLYMDLLTKAISNRAYIAHIVADVPTGPRGDKHRSEKLCKDISNLMLLCDSCHRRIDKDDIAGHPEELLLEMKGKHEKRIEAVTGIDESRATEIVIYRANIGNNTPNIDFKLAVEYVIKKGRYPSNANPIELGMKNSPTRERDAEFWEKEFKSLESNFIRYITPRIEDNALGHVSLFAMAPIPLLVKLGTLLNDQQHIAVHQPTREPKGWNLTEDSDDFEYKVIRPDTIHENVALNISLSGNIINDRITTVLGEDCDIYTLTLEVPNNDFLKTETQLSEFRRVMRKLFNEIKSKYPENTPLHIFPAMPVATAIELGRVRMPKADMPLIIYDQKSASEGFIKVLEIK